MMFISLLLHCITISGWFGSDGADMCKCGVVGDCDGGTDAKCNCDVIDGDRRKDGGTVVNTTQLAICQLCFDLDPLSSLASSVSPKLRSVLPTVSDLFCDRLRTGMWSQWLYLNCV
jgi:hypothetical protein